MGQSGKTRTRDTDARLADASLSVFPTAMGWFGVLGGNDVVVCVAIGHSSAIDVQRRIVAALHSNPQLGATFVESDWHPELRHRLERYCSGVRVDFDDISLALPPGTEFQRNVISLTRKIGYGDTIGYGELAARAGHPRAARAVGSVMASNRFPILVPCHRVVASGGKLGGYTSPQGVDLKVSLLEMEREVLAGSPAARLQPGASRSRRTASTSVR